MRLSAITLFILCLVPALLNTAMGQGFAISPSRIFFNGNPGETVTQTVTFSNTSASPLSFTTRIQDWKRDSTGNKIYFDSGTQPASNARWITLSTNAIVLQPGENKEVIVSLTIPQDARTLTSSMLFFTQMKEQKPIEAGAVAAVGINVLMEVGIQVYYSPKGLNPGEFEFLAFEDRGIITDGAIKNRRLALKIHNKGALNKDAFIRFELTNKETGEELKFDPVTLAMLPEATQWVFLKLPAELKGKFLAVALLDAGSSYDLKVAEKEIIYRP